MVKNKFAVYSKRFNIPPPKSNSISTMQRGGDTSRIVTEVLLRCNMTKAANWLAKQIKGETNSEF